MIMYEYLYQNDHKQALSWWYGGQKLEMEEECTRCLPINDLYAHIHYLFTSICRNSADGPIYNKVT